MNPKTAKDAIKLARATDALAKKYKKVSVGIAPSFVHIPVLPKLKSVGLGAQDVFWENPKVGGGAYTGEVSLEMLKDIGVSFVIVGHSERRKYFGESDEMINKKIKTLVKAKAHLVLCVGEPLSVRSRGLAAAKKYVAGQLKKDLKGVRTFEKFGVVAYEPIWAIGTGRSDSPKLSAEMAKLIKKVTGADVLYGGSVNSKNVKEFLNESSIYGALVGGASLDAKEFARIIEVANKL